MSGAGGGTPTSGPVCDAPSASPSGGSCVTLDAFYTCNPVTAAGCAAGFTCDYDGVSQYICLPPPNTVAACGACSLDYCQPTLTCLVVSQGPEVDQCARNCCVSSDCGGKGHCHQLLDPRNGTSLLSFGVCAYP